MAGATTVIQNVWYDPTNNATDESVNKRQTFCGILSIFATHEFSSLLDTSA